MLTRFMEKTSEAARAVHIERLVKPKWSQQPNAYRVVSSISPREETRLKLVLGQGRYNNRIVD